MSDERAHGEDNPAVLPFPVTPEPDGSYVIRVPASSEDRLLAIQFYAPRTPKPIIIPGQKALPFATGSAVIVGLHAISSLPAAAAGV